VSYAVPTGKELEAIYAPAFRDARARGRDPTPAHFEGLRAVAAEVADYFENDDEPTREKTT
jgi:hypothetical protein